MNIVGIMAATATGVIGKDNGLPWNYPEELDHFRMLTKGHRMIMGQRTFETTPTDLFLERTPIVFSQEDSFKNPYGCTVRDLEECLTLIQTFQDSGKIFMIGGAEIAHLFLEAALISSFILTKIHHPYPGDTYLNLKFCEGWSEEILTSNLLYTIIHLTPTDTP